MGRGIYGTGPGRATSAKTRNTTLGCSVVQVERQLSAAIPEKSAENAPSGPPRPLPGDSRRGRGSAVSWEASARDADGRREGGVCVARVRLEGGVVGWLDATSIGDDVANQMDVPRAALVLDLVA